MAPSIPPSERGDGSPSGPRPADASDNRTVLAHTVYALYAAGFFGYVTAIIGVLVAWAMSESCRGTWLESHVRWQIRTFWYAVLLNVIGWITVWILIGWIILLLTQAWYVWRIAKGWVRLANDEPIASPASFL